MQEHQRYAPREFAAVTQSLLQRFERMAPVPLSSRDIVPGNPATGIFVRLR
ncbi:hypothetical protein PF005_g22876 [Phytophthora fragariae]|uniref:Uncharacterized protein n=1 Tax=Phytophthora fragariae TaxID=53985 RepID=A0A6A3WZU5_9STRA|nr:hypothetical protein PF003_g23593 [Phytophthora fragariae]KAE8926855.1 hypothetical protein PF009_g22962 [Phytophthora fragariae]KAE8970366.1 hypothetical protein PF011_g26449 [Phytophthora fragariae]KAE9080705.1 hypothetical protein PF007_g22941 [Phytophthora fragariae]KAE9080987.1 hypothetical protein PF010_g22169 [Phytophthora fragariae]